MRRRIFAKISASVSLFKSSTDPPFLLDQTERITCPYNDFKDRAGSETTRGVARGIQRRMVVTSTQDRNGEERKVEQDSSSKKNQIRTKMSRR